MRMAKTKVTTERTSLKTMEMKIWTFPKARSEDQEGREIQPLVLAAKIEQKKSSEQSKVQRK